MQNFWTDNKRGGESSTIGFIFMTVLDYYAKSGGVHSQLSSSLQVLRRQEVDPPARRPTACKSKRSLSLRNFDTSANEHADVHTHAFYPFPAHPLSPRRERMRMSECSAPVVSRSSISLRKSYMARQLKLVFFTHNHKFKVTQRPNVQKPASRFPASFWDKTDLLLSHSDIFRAVL